MRATWVWGAVMLAVACSDPDSGGTPGERAPDSVDDTVVSPAAAADLRLLDSQWLRGELDPGSLWGTRTDAISSTWRITVANLSSTTLYQAVRYEAEYRDASGALVQTRAGRLAGQFRPDVSREVEFHDGFVGPSVTSASLVITGASAQARQ